MTGAVPKITVKISLTRLSFSSEVRAPNTRKRRDEATALPVGRRRDVSVTEVVRAHLAQIERVNPKVNAIVAPTAERALDDARAKDAAFARSEAPGPLFGLPVAHKDLVPTKGIRTTFGSPIYRDHVPAIDGLIIERLRAAGAVTLGKTNTPEFGAGSQ